jgi:hypothetical protein
MTNFEELIVRTKIEQIVTEREGMIALNKWREMRGESLAYNELAFQEVCQSFAEVEELIRNFG